MLLVLCAGVGGALVGGIAPFNTVNTNARGCTANTWQRFFRLLAGASLTQIAFWTSYSWLPPELGSNLGYGNRFCVCVVTLRVSRDSSMTHQPTSQPHTCTRPPSSKLNPLPSTHPPHTPATGASRPRAPSSSSRATSPSTTSGRWTPSRPSPSSSRVTPSGCVRGCRCAGRVGCVWVGVGLGWD